MMKNQHDSQDLSFTLCQDLPWHAMIVIFMAWWQTGHTKPLMLAVFLRESLTHCHHQLPIKRN